MPIICNEVENTDILKTSQMYGIKKYVHVKIEAASTENLPFPCDYKYSECFLPTKIVQLSDRIKDFRIWPDDVWIVSFPKSGTTWMLNIVWQLQNQLDFTAKFLNETDYFLERPIFYDSNEENQHNEAYRKMVEDLQYQMDSYENDTSPRVFTSHLPPHLLPREIWTVKPKLIYIYRDPKDVAVSMFHMFRNNSGITYKGTLDEFLDAFLKGYEIYGPYFDHVNSAQLLNHFDHLLLLKYEEMIAHSFNGIKKISKFLNCAYNDKQLEHLKEHVSFQNMRTKFADLSRYENGYNFCRKGKSGGYHDEMNAEYIQKFNEWEFKYSN